MLTVLKMTGSLVLFGFAYGAAFVTGMEIMSYVSRKTLKKQSEEKEDELTPPIHRVK